MSWSRLWSGVRRRVRRRIAGQEAAVLCYHRVFEAPLNRWGVAVTPAHFQEHLEVLTRRFRVIHLHELLTLLREGTVPDRTVVLTFDDGYADNLHAARPLLERYDAPATVFVASGYLGQPREFWWHELERLVFLAPALPQRLTLRLNGREHTWDTGLWPRPATERGPQHREGRLARNKAFSTIRNSIRGLPSEHRSEVLEALRLQVGDDGSARPDYGAMSPDELGLLAAGGLVAIGAHTVNHPYLPGVSPEVQRREIEQSKRELEEILGAPVPTFSYPHGGYTSVTAAIVREVGFLGSGSTRPDLVWRRSDPFALPRLSIKDCPGEALDRKLREWFAE